MNRPGESGDWFEDSAGGWSWFAEAVEATWPKTTVQICVVHLIRNSMRFVSYGQRKAIAAALKTVYTTPTADAAADAFEEFAKSTRTALCSTDPARHGNGLQPRLRRAKASESMLRPVPIAGGAVTTGTIVARI